MFIGRRLLLLGAGLVFPFILGTQSASADDKSICKSLWGDKDAISAACTRVIGNKASSSEEKYAAYVKRATFSLRTSARDVPAQTRAIEDLTAAIKIRPQSAEPYELRSGVYRMMQKWGLARNDLDSALKHAPEDPAELYSMRAAMSGMLRDPAAAMADTNMAIKLANSEKARLGYLKDRRALHRAKGEYAVILKELDELIATKPEVDLYIERARIHDESGSKDLATADFRSASALGSRTALHELERRGADK